MAFSFHYEGHQEPICIESFVEAVKDLDLTDENEASKAAPFLMRFASNRQFLISHLNDLLRKTYLGDDESPYSAQSFILYRCERFFVRINAWVKPKDYGAGVGWEEKAFSYEAPHNHNFDFLTANCLGLGYRTQIYDFDPALHKGFPGEKVNLRFLEDTRLSKNKVLFFRKFRDVHIQHPPDDEISASVNLMISDPVANNSAQFEFNLDRMEITSVINTAHTARKALFRMIKHLGDERSLELLHRIGDKHFDPRVRAFALDAALGIQDDPELVERINYSRDEVFKREFMELR